MKLTVLPLFVAALSFTAQVSAGPIRIYVLAPENVGVGQPDLQTVPAVDTPAAHMRWGLAAANAPQIMSFGAENNTDVNNSTKPIRVHHCAAGAMRMKAIAFSNWLRERVGLEPIMPPPPHLHFPHDHPMKSRPVEGHKDAKIVLRPSFHDVVHADGEDKVVDGPRFHHFHHHPHGHHHHHRPSTFGGRIQRALMTLGPWEGRVVAFVIGCGLGSLLRMLYVLCVVSYRSLSSRKEVEEFHVIFSDVEELPPPEYITDQKLEAELQKTSA